LQETKKRDHQGFVSNDLRGTGSTEMREKRRRWSLLKEEI